MLQSPGKLPLPRDKNIFGKWKKVLDILPHLGIIIPVLIRSQQYRGLV